MRFAITCILAWSIQMACAQPNTTTATSDLTGHVELSKTGGPTHKTSIVVWLNALDRSAKIAATQPGRYTLTQKNRMFSPHLLVIPTGSVVSFPNADPFFHNVFSLFNGKRFDLGLYEAGSSKDVVFSREGVSYIFCNIHPEMSAVVVSLSSPLNAIADSSGNFSLHQLPPGEYELHLWIEGTPQPALDQMIRRVRIRLGASNTVTVDATNAPHSPDEHLNKFGKPYDRDTRSTY